VNDVIARDVGVVIVAAGSGSRTHSPELKQFRWVAGKPMLLHSVHAFQARADVATVVVVLPRAYAGDPPPWLFQSDLDRLVVSSGGRQRGDSVYNGLEDLPPEVRIVLVHDAARPLVTGATIDRVVQEARAGRAAVAALPVVERVDKMLGEAFEAAGGLDRFLQDTAVVLTSDHGHCEVLGDPSSVIRLDQLLGNFRQAALGKAWQPADQVMICPNMRAAQIYVQHPTTEIVQKLAIAMLVDPKVDQVIWRSQLTGGSSGYTVLTHRGRIEFARDGASPTSVDDFGGQWSWSGEAAALDFDVDGRTLCYRQYPNAFERIAGVLDLDESGEIWVTAKPGAEFEVPGGKAHVGGASHGAMHQLDSLSPVIVAGGAAPRRLPKKMRSVDIAPLCMQILGIPMRYQVGDPRK